MEGDKCSKNGCNEQAIGYEDHLHCGYNVCEEHASKEMLKLKPGESKRDLVDYYHKYVTDLPQGIGKILGGTK